MKANFNVLVPKLDVLLLPQSIQNWSIVDKTSVKNVISSENGVTKTSTNGCHVEYASHPKWDVLSTVWLKHPGLWL